ncbi:alpha/beta hydrolase family protein [Flavivirga eckloniae]|uniref:Carboxylic ester hydrolase n=1 Tax=Flavivirga eckloniae TaxID=1803846 RepID=A0A2K9PSC6_9FLAO|nr:hypothetical protein [Flavivirga eckloniae]AUP79966.1 hypothetical protein C1H87_15150 [Flavivirga eckloniae]
MRILEIILLLIVTILPFVKRPLLKIINKKYLLIALATILILHTVIESCRWQLIPAYLLMLVLMWRIISIDQTKTNKLTFLRGLGYIFIIILLIPSWFLPNLLPVFSLPKPTGEYPVGTHSIHLKTNIDEIITKDENDKREFMVKVWYPSSSIVSGKQEPYLDRANRVSFINKYLGGINPNLLNYLDHVDTYVYENVPIVEKNFPVLIFSHGYGSNALGYYSLLTEIASQGYIILNLNHTYESLGSTFPDGREKFFDYEFQANQTVNVLERMKPVKEAFKKELSFEERHAIIREASKGYSVTNMIKRWTTDIIYTIDQLENWNSTGFLKDKLDLNRIGVFGHSRGGGAAGQTAIKDTRIKAAANIDGVQWGEMMDTIYHVPFLYISADWPAEHEDINSHVYKNKSTDYFYESKILTSAHPNFMDIPFMIPIKELAQTGAVDAELGIKITNELVTAFFDRHLKNNYIADPKKISQKYELLEMTIHQGDSIR